MVTKCVCFDKSFADLLFLAQNNNWNFLQLQKNTQCGTACGLCVPYIQTCLESKVTEFEYMLYNALRSQKTHLE